VSYTETGPIYGTPLIKTLPLGSSGMLQACPSRADLEQVAEVNTRTAAAYEVLLGHWQRLQQEAEHAMQAVRYADKLGIYAVPIRHGTAIYWIPRTSKGFDPDLGWLIDARPTIHGWKSWADAVVDYGRELEKQETDQ